MTVVKAELKADGRNLRETFAGAWAPAVTTNASGITVNKWAMTKASGSDVYLAFSDSPTETEVLLSAGGASVPLNAPLRSAQELTCSH